MKLIIMMSIEEYANDLRRILDEKNVPIFSETEISGYRHDDKKVDASWFSGSSEGGIYSSLFFSFIEESKSEELMTAVKKYNEKKNDRHPLRAFLLNVENSV